MKIFRCHRSFWEGMTNSAWESWEILIGGDVTLNYTEEKGKRDSTERVTLIKGTFS